LGSAAGDERQYLIMGVWNTAVSQRELGPDLRAAVHLPCNIVVQERGNQAIVAALDPDDVVEDGLTPAELTSAARDALGRVLKRIEAPA
jgi:uncharacterized protein (DUF302 family)